MTDAAAKPPLVPVLRRRVRSLAILAGVTAIAVIFAVIALWQRSATGESDFATVRMFPSLKAEMGDVTAIQIETKAASFNVTRNAEGRWIVPDKGNYPADANTVLKTILGLSELNLVEQRTARADWHERLGVALPKAGGTGTLVTMKNAKGEVLASVIVGGAVEGASAAGKQAVYVRHAAQPQTYVARGNFAPATAEAQWLDKAFIDLARTRVKTATVQPFKGSTYSVTREKPSDENFRIVEAIPAGRVLRTENEPNAVGNALIGMSFDDVKPQAGMDLTSAVKSTFTTFDGLTLTLSLIEQDRDFWLTINAAHDASVTPPTDEKAGGLKPDVAKEARDINDTVAGWAYKVPRYKGVLLSTPMEDLLRPVGTPAGPTVNP
ncbi:MAG: DUF4340 domain-containing protein [Alphaproteobacteria bacterium]|nr:DUF4340 domain-containing protein [Alphaproteobacteria bacterium]